MHSILFLMGLKQGGNYFCRAETATWHGKRLTVKPEASRLVSEMEALITEFG
jgi:hypothetical protein